MSLISTLPARHPTVPERRTPLTEKQHGIQLQRGLYHVEKGEPLAIPVDRLKEPTTFLNRDLWRRGPQGVYRPGVRFKPYGTDLHRKVLTFLRDRVDARIPFLYYQLVLGHDVHVTTRGDLYARHWHKGWADPFTQEMSGPLDVSFDGQCSETILARNRLVGALGFVENLGWLSGAKVTDIFVSEEIDELVATASTEYADFDFHEVGTSNQAENNNDTALIATSGITRVSGTPTDADPIYQNVATTTADTTETWEEWLLANNVSGPAVMDRSLTGGQAVNSSDQVEYTYQLTKNPEA